MKANITPDPFDVRLLRAITVVPMADALPDAVQEARWGRVGIRELGSLLISGGRVHG